MQGRKGLFPGTNQIAVSHRISIFVKRIGLFGYFKLRRVDRFLPLLGLMFVFSITQRS
jgi:hypothetical protein